MTKLSTALMLALVVACSALVGCGRLLSVETSEDGGLGSSLTADDTFDGGREAAIADDASVARDASIPYVFIPTPTAPLFTDDFTRSDGPDIGNGWIERVPGAFALSGGAVECLTEGAPDQLVRRSATYADAEIGADFAYANSVLDAPSLYLRLQSTPAAFAFVGYRAYAIATSLTIELRTESGMGAMARANVAPSLVIGRTYRLLFRVAGTDPVILEAGLFGEGDVRLASVRAVDPHPTRIVVSGWVAFGSTSPSTRWNRIEIRP